MSFDFAIRLMGAEVIAISFGKSGDPDDPPRMEAGSGHNFERDQFPPDPSGEVPWQDNFGFGAKA